MLLQLCDHLLFSLFAAPASPPPHRAPARRRPSRRRPPPRATARHRPLRRRRQVVMNSYHWWLIASNLTTNEHLNKHRYVYLRDEMGRYRNAFSSGVLRNIGAPPGEQHWRAPPLCYPPRRRLRRRFSDAEPHDEHRPGCV